VVTRLRRRTEQRLIAGVAGGIADRLNASVGFIRVLIGVASALVPWTLAAYAAGALLIPPRGSGRPDWDNLVALARLGVILGVPLVALAPGVDIGEPLGGPPGQWIAYLGLLVAGGVALMAADYGRSRPRTRAEARAVVLAALPVAGCILAFAAGMLLAPDLRWERFIPAVALVGAATLVIAARRGHPGAFLTPALLAVAAARLAVAADVRLQGGLGNTRVTPEATGSPVVARRAVGDLTLDLSRLTRGERAATVEASVGVGILRIFLPRGARVELDARVGKGTIEALRADRETLQGLDRRLHADLAPSRHMRERARIRVEADVGIGEIRLGNVGDEIAGES